MVWMDKHERGLETSELAPRVEATDGSVQINPVSFLFLPRPHLLKWLGLSG